MWWAMMKERPVRSVMCMEVVISPRNTKNWVVCAGPHDAKKPPIHRFSSSPFYFSPRQCLACISSAKYAYRTSVAGAGSRIITLANRHKEANSWYDSLVGRHLSRPVRLTYGNIRRGWSKICKRVATIAPRWKGKNFQFRSCLNCPLFILE